MHFLRLSIERIVFKSEKGKENESFINTCVKFENV